MVLDIKNSLNWGSKNLVVSTGNFCSQTDAGLLVSYAGTSVLVAVAIEKDLSQKNEYFGVPLNVDFSFRDYARGKFPAGFIKREGRQSEREILASRIIDRSIRPLIDSKLKNNITLSCILMSYDKSCKPEIPALIGASIALKWAGVPMSDVVVGVNLLLKKDVKEFNSTVDRPDLDLFVSSTKNSVIMVEADSLEISESDMLSAIKECHEESRVVVDFIEELLSNHSDSIKLGDDLRFLDTNIFQEITESFSDKFQSCFSTAYSNKSERMRVLSNLKSEVRSSLQDERVACVDFEYAMNLVEKKCFASSIFEDNIRIDGRDTSEVREISIAVDLLSEVHGSALFTRGGTQALVVATLGGRSDAQIVDDIDGDRKEAFLLHYNFLPFSVGETGGSKSPSRREIGHGKLAWKAIRAVLPDDLRMFPYSTRLVSEIISSDGSSSMATVCASSLALMRAGVPVKKHVAGVAMGLIKREDNFVVLTDILGYEDEFGDMDFKVAGTEDGITAMQMDMKIQGIDFDILEKALEHALNGRKHILRKMVESVPSFNKKFSAKVPVMRQLQIDKNSVSRIIGSGGKNIKAIAEATASMIDILDDKERCNIVSRSADGLDVACAIIEQFSKACTSSAKIDENYKGLVLSVMDFGVFVEMGFQTQGIIPTSSLRGAVLKDGQIVSVTVKGFDAQKKIKLVLQQGAIAKTVATQQSTKNAVVGEVVSDKVCGVKLPKVVDGVNHRFFTHPQTVGDTSTRRSLVQPATQQSKSIRNNNTIKVLSDQSDKDVVAVANSHTSIPVKRVVNKATTNNNMKSERNERGDNSKGARVSNSITSFLKNGNDDDSNNNSNNDNSEVRFF